MKPIGPLMTEHRLIERCIKLTREELSHFENEKEFDTAILSTILDFLRTYADRTHHGKEEDILFRDLVKKKLLPVHRNIMRELIMEHNHARKTVNNVSNAYIQYGMGDTRSLKDIAAGLKQLIELYPEHIQKEDKQFFYPCLDYFTAEEQDKMLAEFWEFDRKLIHEKYERVISGLESETT